MAATNSINKATKAVALHAKRTAIYGFVALTVTSAFATGDAGRTINSVAVDHVATPAASAIGALIGDVISQLPTPNADSAAVASK